MVGTGDRYLISVGDGCVITYKIEKNEKIAVKSYCHFSRMIQKGSKLKTKRDLFE